MVEAAALECRHFAVSDNYLAAMLVAESVDIVDSCLTLVEALDMVHSYYLVGMVTFAADFADSLDRCHFVASSFLEFRGFEFLEHSMSGRIFCT